MKPKILLFFLFLTFTINLYSQEKSNPMFDTEIERSVSIMDIEGKEYENVKVTLKSISPDYYFSNVYKVKVTIVDMDGKEVWKKTIKNAYLYVFSGGQIQVGKPKFSKLIIYEKKEGIHTGKIREKEGVY